MTSGSTAITFLSGLAFRSIPVAVVPEQPSQSDVYAVAVTENVSPSDEEDADSVSSSFASASLDSSFASSLDSSVTSDRKSTRLNSSHVSISYAVFCLHKKNMNLPGLK